MGSNHLLVSASLDSALSGHASLGTPGSADCLTSEIYIISRFDFPNTGHPSPPVLGGISPKVDLKEKIHELVRFYFLFTHG